MIKSSRLPDFYTVQLALARIRNAPI